MSNTVFVKWLNISYKTIASRTDGVKLIIAFEENAHKWVLIYARQFDGNYECYIPIEYRDNYNKERSKQWD